MGKKMTLQQIEERIEVLYARLYKIQEKYGHVNSCTCAKAIPIQWLIMGNILYLTNKALQFTTPQPKYPKGVMKENVFESEVIMYAIINRDGVVQQGLTSYDSEEVESWFNDTYLPTDHFCIAKISVGFVGYLTNFTP